jgi:ActD protein
VPKEFVVATFTEEHGMRQGVERIRKHGFRVYDVYTPYPVHGLDEAMGIRRTRLPWVTAAAGLFGLLNAVGMQFYMAIFDWNLNVGGKPDNSTLAFVPISFELTVLFAGLATAAALLFRCGLFPGANPRMLEEGTTDDTFAVVLRRRDATFDAGEARRLLLESGARKVTVKAVDW